jgi:hypothetical protein
MQFAYKKKPRFSPLYTSTSRELKKRETIAGLGRDKDGAYRANNRKTK